MAISRVIIRVTPFRALISLRITYLLGPLPLQAGSRVLVWSPDSHPTKLDRCSSFENSEWSNEVCC